MRISVIMMVSLTPYELEENGQIVIRSAPEPETKFIRAVNSFINQSFKDAELIIVADGCRIAEALYKKYYIHISNIRFQYIVKQPKWGGAMRQTGIGMAKGKIICYLDADDMFGKEHLSIINKNFDLRKYDWVYYDDYIIFDNEVGRNNLEKRDVQKIICTIGTSSISHKKTTKLIWGDGYGHDWFMIEKYLLPLKSMKITTPQYYVCHNSNNAGVRLDGTIEYI
jgi:glycosyltransferase involved in cell wall biosynthesis